MCFEKDYTNAVNVLKKCISYGKELTSCYGYDSGFPSDVKLVLLCSGRHGYRGSKETWLTFSVDGFCLTDFFGDGYVGSCRKIACEPNENAINGYHYNKAQTIELATKMAKSWAMIKNRIDVVVSDFERSKEDNSNLLAEFEV